MIRRPMGVATGPIYQRQKPVRDEHYKRFIKTLPSAVSGYGGCDPCHVYFGRTKGLGQSSSDLSCIPLTRKEHDQFDLDQEAFAQKHGIDLAALIARLNLAYELKYERRLA